MECIKQVPPLISSIKTRRLTFKELPVQSIEFKLTNASPAPLQRLQLSAGRGSAASRRVRTSMASGQRDAHIPVCPQEETLTATK